MPYKSYHFKVASRNAFDAAVRAFLLNQGWEAFDAYGAVQAEGYIHTGTNVSNGQYVTIGSKTYTYKTALTPAEGEILRGANVQESLDNLKLAINREDPGTNDGVKYKCAAVHPEVVATTNNDNDQYWNEIIPQEGVITSSTNWSGASIAQSTGSGNAGKRVFVSRGESGDEPPGYFWMHNDKQNNGIYFRAYQYWDAGAHTGTRRAYGGSSETYTRLSDFNSTYDCLIAGDKDMVNISSRADRTPSQNYDCVVCVGHLSGRVHPEITNTTDAIVTGSNVSVPVVSTAGFKQGQEVQIVGISEGCDKIVINGIPDSTTLVIANIPRNYASGAFIGLPASTFGIYNQNNQNFYPCCYHTDSALTVTTTAYSCAALMSPYSWTLTQDKRMMASPMMFHVSGKSMVATMKADVVFLQLTTTYDVGVMNTDGSTPETSTVSSSSNLGLVDGTRDWVPGALIGRYVVITANAGAGQVRKITDNDESSLDIGFAWYTNPDNQSAYKICDTVYRGVHQMLHGTQMSCFRLTDDGVPELPS
jgi:hypothetical protein